VILAMTKPKEEREFRLGWSLWRRAHQAVAKRCHTASREAKRDLLLRERPSDLIAFRARDGDNARFYADGHPPHRREVGAHQAANAATEASHGAAEK
jgi:hypothetical protein